MGKFFSYCLILLLPATVSAQVTANAGPDKTICPGNTTSLGGSPTAVGGTPPYTYSWAPSAGLSSSSVANPTFGGSQNTTYTLTLRDVRDSVDTDIVTVTIDGIIVTDAGPDRNLCLSDSTTVTLGNFWNAAPNTFLWTPATGLSSPTAPRPVVTPTATITYTVKITSPSCGVKTDAVTIYVHSLDISAGPDTSLLLGETITLTASPFDPSYTYSWWNPDSQGLNYSNTYNPDVSPRDTTVYYLTVTDPWGCVYADNIWVYVRPNNVPVFYNSITPNSDGENDVWIIGNLELFPQNKLQIFNRYGQEIYSVTDYKNNWDGKYLGQNLPGGTYYYLFDTRTDKGKYKGSITIFR